MTTRGSRPPPSRAKQSKASNKSTRALYHGSSSSTAGGGVDQHPRHFQQLDTLAESSSLASTLLPMTAGSIVLRNRLPAGWDSNPQVRASVTHLHAYLEHTGIDAEYAKLCRLLLTQENLPYNPYPGMVKRLRLRSEKYHMFRQSDEDILEVTDGSPIIRSSIAFLVRPQHDSCPIWGLHSLVSVTDPKLILHYKQMLDSLMPPLHSFEHLPHYSNQAMLALVGPAVYHGLLGLGTVHMLTVRAEYLVTGADVEEAVNLFIHSVYNDISHMEGELSSHIVLGVNLPVMDENGKWRENFWSYIQIQQYKTDFFAAVGDSVTANKYISAECVFCVNEEGCMYTRGQKQYGLNFVQVASNNEQEEGLHYFSEYALVTLHEGVFMHESHAEAYLTLFTPRLTVLDKDSRRSSQEADISSSKTDSSFTGSILSINDKSGIKRFKKKNRVKIDGFRQQRFDVGPNAWQVTAPIKSDWQRKIASSIVEPHFFEILHLILLLVFMDRKAYTDELVVELYRALHSTAARLKDLIILNKAIRETIVKFEGFESSSIVNGMFGQYKEGIAQLLDNNLHERSSDQIAACKMMMADLDDITLHHPSVPLNAKSLSKLKNMNSYASYLLVQLVEDVMALSPHIKEVIKSFQDAFPDEKPLPVATTQPAAARGGRGPAVQEVRHHGYEDQHISTHDNFVINVPYAIERGEAPKIVALESVLLRYVVDTHMDKVWPEYLVDLFSSKTLPPNPYPRLVTAIRKAAFKMDVNCASESGLLSRLLPGCARVEESNMYHIPGSDLYGMASALAAVDANAIAELAPKLQPFINTDFKKRRGPYKIAICTALGGLSSLYGRMEPYLQTVELHEHCYIRGPKGCWGEAVQIYTKIVFHEMQSWYRRGEFPILGVYMGGEHEEKQRRWSPEDILDSRQAFAAEFEQHILMKEACYSKAYLVLDWRLVPVLKHLHLHFMDEDESQFEVFSEDNESLVYQSVFFDKEKAAFHLQYGGPGGHGALSHGSAHLSSALNVVERKVLESLHAQDWINVQRNLLCHSLMTQSDSSVVVEVWRMLHSVAAQVEFTIQLGRSLQDAVLYALELSTNTSRQDQQKQQLRIQFIELMCVRMLGGFIEKMEEVCERQCSMAPTCLSRLLIGKMNKITRTDPITRQRALLIKKNCVDVLEEVCEMLRGLHHAIAHDGHASSVACQAAVRRIESAHSSTHPVRPTSVDSVQLASQRDISKPQQQQSSDYVNEWMLPGL